MCYLPNITVTVRLVFFLHLSHGHEPTHDPGFLSHDPAPNPVTALATFDISQFLADNVSIMVTRADMLPTFPTKPWNTEWGVHQLQTSFFSIWHVARDGQLAKNAALQKARVHLILYVKVDNI